MIVDDFGSRLTGGEVPEIIGLILENTSGFETVDSNAFTQAINETGNLHDFRYDARAHIERGLRKQVIYVRKSLSKASTLRQEIT